MHMMDLLQTLQAPLHLEDKAGSGDESCSPAQLHTNGSLSQHTHIHHPNSCLGSHIHVRSECPSVFRARLSQPHHTIGPVYSGSVGS